MSITIQSTFETVDMAESTARHLKRMDVDIYKMSLINRRTPYYHPSETAFYPSELAIRGQMIDYKVMDAYGDGDRIGERGDYTVYNRYDNEIESSRQTILEVVTPQESASRVESIIINHGGRNVHRQQPAQHS